MLDNFLNNLPELPSEAFTETGDVVKKVIDKVSGAVGWIVKPTANKTYQLQAEKYLIDQIENDSNMPPLAKAAAISKVRKLIKEYLNQQNILSIGLNFLNDSAKPENIDDDWLMNFFEKAKNISKEEMAIIWGKILSKEINTPGSVSKSLIHILSIVSYKEAEAFLKLANFSVTIEDRLYVIIYDSKYKILYSRFGLIPEDIFNLADIGLVQHSDNIYFSEVSDGAKLKYFDCEWDVGEKKEVGVGNVILSRAGEELLSIITDVDKIADFKMFLQHVASRTATEMLVEQYEEGL